jgi:hypothetical protein
LSNPRPVLSGIPQGSVLGPLLFIIYINDLPDMCKDLANAYLFADDAKLYKCIQCQDDSVRLNDCFNQVLSWSERWLMKLNTKKCKVLLLCSNKNNIVKYSYGFDSQNLGFIALDREESIKDLGVIVDSELSFASHVYDKVNSAYRILGVIRRNFLHVDKLSFLTLYKSLVRCHLEFNNSVWNPHRLGLVNDIEKVQKRATKLIKGCSALPYKERLMYLHLPTLKYRRLRGDMIEAYKILHNNYAVEVAPVLHRNLDTRTRGNLYKLLVERCRLDIRKFSFTNRVVNAWNALPNTVVDSKTLTSFKCNLDKFYMHKEIYYDFEAHCDY